MVKIASQKAKRIFYITHPDTEEIPEGELRQKEHRGTGHNRDIKLRKEPNPSLSHDGLAQAQEMREYLEKHREKLGFTGFNKIVAGTGDRFYGTLEELKVKAKKPPIEYDELVGGTVVMQKIKKSGRIVAILPGMNVIDRKQYRVENRKPAIEQLLARLPHDSAIVGGRAALYALGIDEAESATIYAFYLKGKKIVGRKTIFSASKEQKKKAKVNKIKAR